MLSRLKGFIKRNFLVPRRKLVVLTLHQATVEFDARYHCEYTWSDVNLLESNLEYLVSNHEVVPLMDGIENLTNGKLKGTQIAITFDDGDKSLATDIMPLFEKYDLPVTFFINTAYLFGHRKGYWFNIYNFIKNGDDRLKQLLPAGTEQIIRSIRNTTDPSEYKELSTLIESMEDHLENFNPYITRKDLENMNNRLFTIGLHGHEHQRYAMMPLKWKKSDLELNIRYLSGHAGYIPVFALPFGKSIDYDPDTRMLCQQLGLKVALSDRGYNTKAQGHILRIPADGKDFKMIINNLQPN